MAVPASLARPVNMLGLPDLYFPMVRCQVLCQCVNMGGGQMTLPPSTDACTVLSNVLIWAVCSSDCSHTFTLHRRTDVATICSIPLSNSMTFCPFMVYYIHPPTIPSTRAIEIALISFPARPTPSPTVPTSR